MSSSNSFSQRRFCLKTEIFEEKDLKTCFEKLDINENDLIIAGSSSTKKILKMNCANNAKIIETTCFGKGEPEESWVNEILRESNQKDFQRVIAIGGGGILDIAKFCVFGDGRSVQQLFDAKENLIKKRELIAIPTTCGTGSEVTSVAVVEMGDLHSKLGLQIDELFPDKAILIGELLKSLPYPIFANTAIDALAHAVESLLSPKANVYTDLFAKEALKVIIENFMEVDGKKVLPANLQSALVAANMAGIAFSIAGCATMHALSFPLGARYRLVHGEAVYAVMKSTLNYYKSEGVSLNKLENALADVVPQECDKVDFMLKVLEKNHPALSFKDLRIDKAICIEMANSVYDNQQRLLVNSPKKLNVKDLTKIYENCL